MIEHIYIYIFIIFLCDLKMSVAWDFLPLRMVMQWESEGFAGDSLRKETKETCDTGLQCCGTRKQPKLRHLQTR